MDGNCHAVVSGMLVVFCKLNIQVIGLRNLMSASVGVDHRPDPELTAMVATAAAYTLLVLRRQPLHVVVVGFPTICIDSAACYSVERCVVGLVQDQCSLAPLAVFVA